MTVFEGKASVDGFGGFVASECALKGVRFESSAFRSKRVAGVFRRKQAT